jgi:hypothetical protein
MVHSLADCNVIRELRAENERLRRYEGEVTRMRGSLAALRALMDRPRSSMPAREIARWIDALLDDWRK